MAVNLKINDSFPDIGLPDQTGKLTRLSHYTRASLFDQRLGFNDGYPLILVFLRGFFCPRDQ
ncbi:MAG TPA: cold-shock protein, partial [Chloroflexia bacterium]|nr:cold-shock protein [Chloroflexia bacterium]